MKERLYKNFRTAAPAGYTIIELVVVLVLAGLLAAVVGSRFLGPSAFNAAAARDSLISAVNLAQQMALGRTSVNFHVDGNAINWAYAAREGTAAVHTITAPLRGVVLETGNTDTCAAGLETPLLPGFEITFDALGNAVEFRNGAGGMPQPVGNGVRICVNDSPVHSVCVSPGGFAHAGNCDE